MSRASAVFVAVLSLSAVGCSVVVDFDTSKLRMDGGLDGARPDAACMPGRDPGCTGTCGNGVLETGETCDPESSCPATCEDGTACTADTLSGRAAECNVACERQPITTCRGGDGCCPSSCSFMLDSDCTMSCGNGTIDPGETCDPVTSCRSSCNDGNACTIDTTIGSMANCNVACSYRLLTACTAGDGCCPAGCNATNDADCTTTCGNGAVEPGETCDPASLCPGDCEDGNACTINTLTGSAANCNVACSSQVITQCQNDDDCCPGGCSANNDNDCTTTCNNGEIEPGETCDPPGSCPQTCNDGNACTIDSLTGSLLNCTAACVHQQISQCQSGDGCCPVGCNANTDGDCTATCNNGVVESGETCDPPSACPQSCNDGTACTIDSLTGSAANCNVACSSQTITQCRNGDGCCAAGCNANNDGDCTATCNNGVIEAGETCDPRTNCPAACSDGNACTADVRSGSVANCNVACSHPSITQCQNGDGCCPAGCNANNDGDCTVTCGNGAIEGTETCDPPTSCPATCNDANACTVDSSSGSAANCNLACSNQPITQCAGGDSCCPPGCNAANDSDCAGCGNGRLDPGETCDPPSSCPSCVPENSCQTTVVTGSANTCNAVCTRMDTIACMPGDSCCPATCNASTDADCTAMCGNSVVEPGETCDPLATCPTAATCVAAMCETAALSGDATMCTAVCTRTPITACANGDGCCPATCNASTDNNCTAVCGNSVLEPGETCDPPGTCPTAATCTASAACETAVLSGDATMCTAVCTRAPACNLLTADACCPTGCTIASDVDCTM